METQGRQIEPAARPSAQHGLGRRHRLVGRQPAGRAGRPRAGRRLAAAGFHHRLVGAVQGRATSRSSGSTCSRSTPASTARCRWSPTRKVGLDVLDGRLGRLAAPATPGQATAEGRQGPAWLGAAKAVTDPTNAAALGRAGDRRGAARARARARRWCAPRAACRASCTSSGRPARRAATTWNTATRPWATRSPAGSASSWPSPTTTSIVMVGDGCYMMMNSEIATSVMLGKKLTIVRARQSRLRLHQPAADGDRRRQLQQSAARTRSTRCCREIDFVKHARVDGRGGAQGRPRSPSSKRTCKAAEADDRTIGDRHRHRPADLDRGRRALVGRGGAGSQRAAAGERGAQGI